MGFLSYFVPRKAQQTTPPTDTESQRNSVAASTSDSAATEIRSHTSRSALQIPNDALDDVRCNVMVNWLSKQQAEMGWIHGDCAEEGVVLKKGIQSYTCFPPWLEHERGGLFDAIQILHVRAAMTIKTMAITLILDDVDDGCTLVPLANGLHVQVLPDISALARCQKNQFAAFILNSGFVVVWDDDPNHLIQRATELEESLIAMAYDDTAVREDEKKGSTIITTCEVPASSNASQVDIERADPQPARPVMLQMPIAVGVALFLAFAAIGMGWRKAAIEMAVDKNYMRLAFIVALIPRFWLSLFFFQALAVGLFQIFGPTSQMEKNTKFYSAHKPQRLQRDTRTLPHVTIQMPVYKEGLYTVIEPTVRSIKAAMSTYEMQGGTANLFINDDGMQLISEKDACARQDFYHEHEIGWVARPAHNPNPTDGSAPFLRRGKFKKASNMNYAMWISSLVEDKLAEIDRSPEWTQDDETAAYEKALEEVVDGNTVWADGNIRMGDYILLIDSDTRVPIDCFLDAVSEMEESPQVAILQYSSGVMNVTSSFFEKGITFFTNLVYTQIRYAVSSGDVAPFVGHNAILRWSAVQEISFEEDDREKWWSEATVSEDFDMALRLQTQGYVCRLAAYQGDGFKEGVSLTVYDELARWEKYAYGCNELVFHPLRYWFTRGPFTKLFRTFLFSPAMPLPSKFTIIAYVGTYYAIGSAWLLTMLNYFLIGWFNGYLDHFYLDSFKIYFSIIIVFTALGNVGLAVLRYRTHEKGFIASLWENFSWVPLLTIFLGGSSLHISQALLSHMLGIDMAWGSTTKEAEDTTFFQEIPKILSKFKWTLVWCLSCIAMIVALACFVPHQWAIDHFVPIWPLATGVFAHLMLPIALNPGLMRFTW